MGPYRVVRQVGSGGLARVYEVAAPDGGRRLALKHLVTRGAAEERFAHEFRVLSMLDHPGVVAVIRFGCADDGLPWFTMPLIEGDAAQTYVRARGRPGSRRRTAAAIRVGISLCESLAHIHSRGVVHRDVKSANVLVHPGGRVCLIDFGTARDTRDRHDSAQLGEFVGTYAYASPEQLGGAEVDGRSDLYALGVLLYRLVTGRRPFEGEDPHRLARQHLHDVPVRVDELVGGVPVELGELIARLLAKRPDDRPAGAAEVRDALRALPLRASPRRLRNRPTRLIGRESAENTLEAVLQRARPGRLVIVSGPFGSGRRRLATQTLERARRAAWVVNSASFEGSEGLGGWVELARGCARGLRPGADGLSVGLEGALAALERGTDDEAARQAVLDLVTARARASQRPLALGLWCLDQADEAALDVLERLRERVRAGELPVVCFATSGGAHDGPVGRLRHRFPDAPRVDLLPLDLLQTERMLHELGDGARPLPEVVQEVWRASGGLPDLIELIARNMTEGLSGGPAWLRLRGAALSMPHAVREALAARLRSLDAETRLALGVLHLAGEPVSVGVIDEVLEWGADRSGAVVARLEEAGLASRAGDSIDVAVGLLARILFEDESLSGRRQALLRRLVTALPSTPPRAARVRLMMAAGLWRDASLAADELVSARRPEGRLAELRPLLETLHPRVGPEDGELRLALHLAEARLEVGREVDEALAALPPLPSSEELAPWASLQAQRLRVIAATRRGWFEDADDALERIRVLGDSGEADVLEARCCLEQGRLAEGRALASRVERGQAGLRVGRRLAWAAGALSELDLDPQDEDPDAWMLLCARLRLQGRWTEAEERLSMARRRLRAEGARLPLAWVVMASAETALDLVRLGEAREHVAYLRALLGAGGPPSLTLAADRVVARAWLAGREPVRARRALERAVRRAEKLGQRLTARRLQAWLGRSLLDCGDREAGEAALEEASASLRELGARVALAEATALRVRGGGESVDPDVLFGPLEGWLEGEVLVPWQLCWRLSVAERALVRGERMVARRAFSASHDLLEQLESLQGTQRATLRVHPWRVRIRRGLSTA